MGRLANRSAIVTGSAQGMGLAIATALGAEGARVAVVDVVPERIEAAVAELKGKGVTAAGFVMDVTSREEVRKVVGEVAARFDGVDILVNNAGGSLHTPYVLDEIEEKHWDLVVDVNLKGAFFCCQAVIPLMAQRGRGAIINMSALAGHWRASLAGVQYTAAKAGVEGLTRQLAYDFGPKNIRVNAVAPTVVLTGERMQGLWDKKDAAEQQRILGQIPLRRLSTAAEIGAAVVFLVSDEASFITGITLDVSGGRYLR